MTSTLTMRLIDGITAPAKKIQASLKGVEAAAVRLQRQKVRATEEALARRSLGMGAERTAGAAFLAGGGALIGTALAGGAAAKGYRDTAAMDRRLTLMALTADAGTKAIAELRAAVMKTAQETGAPVEQVVAGLESLIAAGRSVPEAIAFLPAVTATATAAGAEVLDLAKSADAFGTSFRIAGGEMQSAFDQALKLGKAGKFELKDQARYLPSILPQAATRGLKGLEGLAKVGAALQVIRQNSGTSEEAAVALSDVLGKLDSEETVNKMRKNFGIDLPKALEKGRKAGKNTFDTFLDIVEVATKGNMEKLNQIFNDKEARRGIVALMQYRDQYRQLQQTAKNSAGEVAKDLAAVSRDTQASIDRLSNSWTSFVQNLARTADAAGASGALDDIAKNLSDIEAVVERIKRGDVGGAVRGGLEFLGRGDITSDSERRHEAAAAASNELNDLWDRRRATYDRRQPLVERYDAIRAKGASRTPEEDRLARRMLPQVDALTRDLTDLDAMIPAAFERAAGAMREFINGLPAGTKMGGVGGLPVDPADERPVVPASMSNPPLPPRKPTKEERAAEIEAPPVKVGAVLDPAAAEAAALEASRRVQAVLDANRPVIRVRVDATTVSGDMGARVSSGVAGAHADLGAGGAAR